MSIFMVTRGARGEPLIAEVARPQGGGPAGGRFGYDDVARRNRHDEAGTPVRPDRVDPPTVGADDTLGDREPQARPARLRGEPGSEESRRIVLEPLALVPDHQLRALGVDGPFDADPSAGAARIDRVGDQVHEDL